MLIDTHCHLNMMVKKSFDTPLTEQEVLAAHPIIAESLTNNVKAIINVGTSLIESMNCIVLAQRYPSVCATIGIHPNDLTDTWKDDISKLSRFIAQKETNRIVGIGEIGVDRHYPEHNLARQHDAFKLQLEMALENDLAIVIHSRDAYDETLRWLEEYSGQLSRGVMHCYSYDVPFAEQIIDWGMKLGIGGTITYPNNQGLREVIKEISLHDIVLETDAPFLPPQSVRGTQNTPANIPLIAEAIAELKDVSVKDVGRITTDNARAVFQLKNIPLGL